MKLLVPVAMAVFGLALTGCAPAVSPHASGQPPTTSRAATPRPTAPRTPSATPVPTPVPTAAPAEPAVVNGYDARQAWDLCLSEGKRSYPNITDYAGYSQDAVQAGRDGSGLVVTLAWQSTFDGNPISSLWLCSVGGDPSAPTIDGFTTPDK